MLLVSLHLDLVNRIHNTTDFQNGKNKTKHVNVGLPVVILLGKTQHQLLVHSLNTVIYYKYIG